ncbi:MAG: hypothetical protein WCQ69_01270 [Bacteroidales bacterium]|nr:hypothetical protein [Bacteroidales bacterium]MDD3207951.1 hypothetical protein [Bacteroidales bacterium]MDD3696542.1 hypothetical protein [Bacteroidales bacterium]MDD4167308.1 hypothetical protein [Bacteroidales bacterium]MDD4472440.1 hypothetical protein [Bacteroidales bacterium]
MDIPSFYKKYLNASPQELAPYGYILQDMLRRYPWFSLGRLLLFKSLCGLGGEASLSESEKTAAYVYSRSKPFFILQESLKAQEKQSEEDFFTLDLTQEIEKEETPPPSCTKTAEFVLESPAERTFYPGADYFGKADMSALELDVTVPIDRFISENPRFTQVLRRTGENVDTQNQDMPPVLGVDDFVTETLARIYAQQGYHKLAIACYGKLILLYPEKSAYFASLVQEIKQKTNS